MASDPQQFFRFAAEHYVVLVDLFYRQQGFSDAALRELILRHRRDDHPSPTYIEEQLRSLGIIEATAGATAVWELTQHVRDLLQHLLRAHRLTSSAVIQGYLAELDTCGQELASAVDRSDENTAFGALDDVASTIERVRQDSRANREAIVERVIELKANRERLAVRERFEIINRLWARYLEPLKDLIDVRKAMDDTLDGLDRRMGAARRAFRLDTPLVREVDRARARLVRLRRDVAADFRESLNEVGPLYSELRRETAIARGASLALSRIDRSGVGSLELVSRMAFPVFQVRGVLSDGAIEAYFAVLNGYEPAPKAPLPSVPRRVRRPILQTDDVLRAMRMDLPIDDVLGWLTSSCRDARLRELLRVYGRVHSGALGRPRFGDRPATYRVAGHRVRAHPMRVTG